MPWIPDYGIHYYVGIDGISLLLVLLTTFLMPIALLASWHDIERVACSSYVFFMLFLETGMLGAFVSLNLFLFYVFWELMLVPMYFIIGIWGGPRRDLRGGQVLPVHDGRLAADAGRDPRRSTSLFQQQTGAAHVRPRRAAGQQRARRCSTR